MDPYLRFRITDPWIRSPAIYQSVKEISEKVLIFFIFNELLHSIDFSMAIKISRQDPKFIGPPVPDPQFRITDPRIHRNSGSTTLFFTLPCSWSLLFCCLVCSYWYNCRVTVESFAEFLRKCSANPPFQAGLLSSANAKGFSDS